MARAVGEQRFSPPVIRLGVDAGEFHGAGNAKAVVHRGRDKNRDPHA